MAAQPLIATIIGIPQATEVNIRSGPTTTVDIVFKSPKNLTGQVVEVQPDSAGANLNGKVYQWFRVNFSDGRQGWVRDDLITVQGDGTVFGYTVFSAPTTPFYVQRNMTAAPAAPTPPAAAAPAAQPVQPVTTTQPVAPTIQPVTPVQPVTTPTVSATPIAPTPAGVTSETEMRRVRKASFAITGAFEGHGYAAYNNYDAGIVSYGIIQFTLAAGSLVTVINRYLERSQSDTANQLRGYQPQVNNRDPLLRNDTRFRDLLIAAANETEMQTVQDEVAAEGFWMQVVDGYITPRAMKLPLTYALLFDMGVNFGVNHGFVRLAEQQLGVPSRSKPGENGITEEQLMTRVAQLRKESHDKQAARDNLPGLAKRGNFWMDLVTRGDWQLQGDANGNVNVNGRLIQVRNI